MTANKNVKKLVRRRMTKTGERYQAALRHVRAALALTGAALATGCAPQSTAWEPHGSDPGSYAMELAAPDAPRVRAVATPAGFGTMMRTVDAAPWLGLRVRLRAGVRATDVAGWAGLWMRVDGPKEDGARRRPLAFDNMEERALRGTASRACEIVLDVPPEATAVAYGVLLDGAGSVETDALRLEAVGDDVATTERPAGAFFRAGSRPRDYAMGFDAAAPDREGHPGASFLRSQVADPTGFGTWMAERSAEPFRGRRARLSGWVRASDVVGAAGLWLRVDGPDGMIQLDNMHDRPIRGTTGWSRYDVTLDVPEAATRIAYGALLQGAGALDLDGLDVSPVD